MACYFIAAAFLPSVHFEGVPSSRIVHLNNVTCTGSEDRLDECTSQDGSVCEPGNDVGLICTVLQGKL